MRITMPKNVEMIGTPQSTAACLQGRSNTDQLRGPRRFAFADLVSCIRLFGRLCGLEGRRVTRPPLPVADASARRAWLTDSEFGKASDTSGSRRTTLELWRKRS